jgi:MFS family permease
MRAYALLYWAINLGFAGAAMLAGLLARYDFLLLFIGDATTTTVFGVIVLLRVPETLPLARAGTTGPPPAADLFAPYRDPVFLSFVLIQFGVAWVFRQGDSSLALDMTRHGISMPLYGQLLAINGILIIVLQPLVVRYIGRIRRAHGLALGALLTGVGFGMCALGHGLALYAASIIVWTLGEIVFSPLAPALIADLAPRELRGSYQGAFQICWGGAGLLGPAVGGLILGRLGPRLLWLVCLAVGTLAAGLHLLSAPARLRRLAALPDAGAALGREDPFTSKVRAQ